MVVDGARIARVGRDAGADLHDEGVRVVDVSGKWVLPGLIDIHVHLREPGQEYKEDIASGLAAAAHGGFTGICCMPNTRPVNDNRAVTETIVARAREVGGPWLRPFGAITVGLGGTQLAEMADMKAAGAIGVTDDGRCIMDAAVMRSALQYARTFDLVLSQHCEDHHLTQGAQMHEGAVSTRLGLRGWPREAEDAIIARDLILAEQTGARYHVAHISSKGAVRLVREAKARGIRVTAEVTPHHLTLTHEALVTYDTDHKVNPPLRTAEDREALREALRDGTIDCVATDHAPHTSIEKDCEFQAASVGINGLETALPLLLALVHDGSLSPLRMAEAMSTGAARVIGDAERGALRPGAPADITVVDPEHRWTVEPASLRSKSHNTPWLGREVRGGATMTVVAGRPVFEAP